jgi:hypothetical protein
MKFIIFLIVIIIVILAGLYFIHKPPHPVTKPKQEVVQKALFTPQELIAFVDPYNPDKIAEQCMDKNFKKFVTQENGHSQYRYYNIGNDMSNSDNEYYCKLKMVEELTFSDTVLNLTYIIKNETIDSAFISYLKNNTQEIIPAEKRLSAFRKNGHYVINNCVFIDQKFQEPLNGYCIRIVSKAELNTMAAKEKAALLLKSGVKRKKSKIKIVDDEDIY